MKIDSSDKLRRVIIAQLHKHRKEEETYPASQARVMGAFIEAALLNSSRTRSDFAREMGIDNELADALLEGELPASIISDRTLADIARIIDYDANLLRLMLGRSIIPNLKSEEVQRIH